MDALVANQYSLIHAFPPLKLLSHMFHRIKTEGFETGPDKGGNAPSRHFILSSSLSIFTVPRTVIMPACFIGMAVEAQVL